MSSIFKSPLHAAFFCAIAIAFYAATLYPFRWLSNGAELVDGRATFPSPGALRYDGPKAWLREAAQTGEISVSVRARSFSPDQTGPARILTISRGAYTRDLTIAQNGPDLELRLRRSRQSPNGLPPFVVKDVFRDGNARTIVVSIAKGDLRLGIDGAIAVEQPLPERPLSSWGRKFDLILGNESSWDRPWLGELTRAVVATPSVALDLLRPSAVHKPFLSNPITIVGHTVIDIVLNFSAFVLIGMFSSSCLRRRSPMLVGLLWAPISLSAECLQVFVMGRNPSLSDFLLNVSGAAIGGLIYSGMLRDALTEYERAP